MAGTIALTPDIRWSVRGSTFYWIIEFLADELDDPDAKRRLKEIDEDNLGWLGLDDFAPPVQDQMLNKIRFELIPATTEQAAGSPSRQDLLDLLGELVELAHQVHGRR